MVNLIEQNEVENVIVFDVLSHLTTNQNYELARYNYNFVNLIHLFHFDCWYSYWSCCSVISHYFDKIAIQCYDSLAVGFLYLDYQLYFDFLTNLLIIFINLRLCLLLLLLSFGVEIILFDSNALFNMVIFYLRCMENF